MNVTAQSQVAAGWVSRLVFFLCLLWVCVLYGSIPYLMLGHLGIVEWQIGFAQSLATGGFFSYPGHMSHPLGAPIVFGASYAYVQAAVMWLTSLDGMDAYGLTSILFLTFAFWGAARLLRYFGAGVHLSYVLAATYLAAPFNISHTNYAALAYGMAMLPAYAFMTLLCFNGVLGMNTLFRRKVFAALGFVATAVFALFLDGYTFVMFAVVGVFFVVHVCADIGGEQRRPAALYLRALVLYLCAFGCAYLLMLLYVPGLDELRLQRADVYRSMGLDLLFVLWPASNIHWLASAVLDPVVYDARIHYGDGSLATGSYLGVGVLTALAGLLLSKVSPAQRGLLFLLLLVSVLLSLGPSLKYDARRLDLDHPDRPPVQYHMPKEAAVLSLGLDRFYETVPGIKNMRATYRWHALTHFLVWFLTSVFLIGLWRAGWRRSMCLLLLVYAADRAPSPTFVVERARKFYESAEVMTQDVVIEMGRYLSPGQIVYFWPSGNDFFVNYAAPILGIRAYNVGGDKNMDISRNHWPAELLAVERGECVAAQIRRLAGSGKLDAVVVPKFNMLWDVSKPWPLDQAILAAHAHRFKSSPLSGSDFDIQESTYFYVLKVKPQADGERHDLLLGHNWYFSTTEPAGQGKACQVHGLKGFSVPEKWGRWTSAAEAGFVVNLMPGSTGPLELELEWMGFVTARHPLRTASLHLDGQVIHTFEYRLGDAPQVVRVPLGEAGRVSDRSLSFSIRVDDPESPLALGLSSDPRQLGIALRRVCIARPGEPCVE